MSSKISSSLFHFYDDYLKICNFIICTSALQNPHKLYLAVLSAEDKYFLTHKGVSIKSLVRAVVKRHGGGSTINMQLVRTITNRKEITLRRKIREIFLSIFIDLKFSKKQILDCYLENAYFGYRLHGIKSVLEKIMKNKKTNDLSLRESCFIAALLKRPYNPSEFKKWQKLIQRRISHTIYQCKINEKKLSKKIKSTL